MIFIYLSTTIKYVKIYLINFTKILGVQINSISSPLINFRKFWQWKMNFMTTLKEENWLILNHWLRNSIFT